uniref:GIR1-like zinc ribbon domain-containing protein n=1 Tax=Oryza barthii TaxID=65489 RepID=A0A0D3G0D9_9ORYZ
MAADSGKTFLTPRLQGVHVGHQDLNLPPPPSYAAAAASTSAAAGAAATPASPSMRAAACPSCLTYVLIAEADPRCPRCAGNVPPLAGKPREASAGAGDGSGKKPKIDLNAAADDTE